MSLGQSAKTAAWWMVNDVIRWIFVLRLRTSGTCNLLKVILVHSGHAKKFEFFHWLTKNECAAEIKITKFYAFRFTSGQHSAGKHRAGEPCLARFSKK